MRMFQNKVLMRTSPMEEEVTVDGENYMVTNLIICTLHQIHQGNQIKEKRCTGQAIHIREITNTKIIKMIHIGCETMEGIDVY